MLWLTWRGCPSRVVPPPPFPVSHGGRPRLPMVNSRLAFPTFRTQVTHLQHGENVGEINKGHPGIILYVNSINIYSSSLSSKLIFFPFRPTDEKSPWLLNFLINNLSNFFCWKLNFLHSNNWVGKRQTNIFLSLPNIDFNINSCKYLHIICEYGLNKLMCLKNIGE